jgi:uncharacterized membrane protein
MTLRTVILWIHVLCGVAWVGVCASFVLAASALSTENHEWQDFALRTAPLFNRVIMVVACIIPVTGIGNLYFAARARAGALPLEFLVILSAKIGLFAAMAMTLWAAWGAEAAMRRELEAGDVNGVKSKIHRLIGFYGLSVGLGAVALGLGLWLSGT